MNENARYFVDDIFFLNNQLEAILLLKWLSNINAMPMGRRTASRNPFDALCHFVVRQIFSPSYICFKMQTTMVSLLAQ